MLRVRVQEFILRRPRPLHPTPLAALRADELPLLHIEAALRQQFPLVKPGSAERFTLGTLLFVFAEADDGHKSYSC